MIGIQTERSTVFLVSKVEGKDVMTIDTELFQTITQMPESLKQEVLHYAKYLIDNYLDVNAEQKNPQKKQRIGILKGTFVLPLPDDFDQPLEDFENPAPSIAHLLRAINADNAEELRQAGIEISRLEEIRQGAYPRDWELVFLAHILKKADGSCWRPEELLAIRERDFKNFKSNQNKQEKIHNEG